MADDNLGIPLPEASPQNLRTPYDPEGKGPRQGMSFGENVGGTFRSGTIEGAVVESVELDTVRGKTEKPNLSDLAWIAAGQDPMLMGVGDIDPWRMPVPEPEKRRQAQKLAEDAFYDQVAYDLNPSRFTPASVAGTLVGGLAAPSNLAGITSILRNATMFATRPILTSAVSAGVATGATDLATQGIRIGSGAQAGFELERAVMAPFLGAAVGSGGHVAMAGIAKLPPVLASALERFKAGKLDMDAPNAAAAAEVAPGAPTAANDAASAVAPEPKLAARPAPPDEPPVRIPDLPDNVSVVDEGNQGPVLEGLGGRWTEAVDWLRSARTGDARGVLEHPDVPGRIDVVWGEPRIEGRSEGFGLAKIEQLHPEVVADLPARLAETHVVSSSPNRIRLQSDETGAVVRLDLDGETKTWLLTAYDRPRGDTTRSAPADGQAPKSPARPADGNIAPKAPDEEPPPVLYRTAASVRARFDNEARAIGDELFKKKGPVSPHPNEMTKGRPNADQGTPLAPDARVSRIEELSQKVAADFEGILRTGRVKAGALGTYNIKSGVSRVRGLSDLDTTIHEIGHSFHLDPGNKPKIDALIARGRAELAPVGAGQGVVGDREAFAELFRLYAMNRPYAQKTYPQASAELDRVLKADFPKQAAALDELQVSLDALHRADSGAVVSADVVTPAQDSLFVRILDALGLKNVGAEDIDPSGRSVYKWRDALFTRYIDSHNPILQGVEALAKIHADNTGKPLDILPADNPYIRARLSAGSNGTAEHMLKNGVMPAGGDMPEGPSFYDAIHTAIGRRWTEDKWHEFGAYLVSRRMVAEYDRFLAGEIPNPPGKFSQADYARAVVQFEKANPAFAQGAAQLYEFQTRYLTRAFDSHLFTASYRDAALTRVDYVPLHRDMTDLGSDTMVSIKGSDLRKSMMQAFRGSQRSPLNPLDMIYKRVHDFEFTIAANETKRTLADLAEIAGPGSGFIAEKIPSTKLSATQVDILDALQKAGQKAHVDPTDLGALIRQAEGVLGDDVFAKIFRQEDIRPGQEPITFYFENGERKALRLSDGRFGAELYRALNTMTSQERNAFTAALQMSQALLRTMVTKSVGFIYRNFMRDQLTSSATGGRNYIPFVSAIRGGLDVLFKGGDFERYIGQGGYAGGLIMEAVDSGARGRNAQAFRERSPFDPMRYGRKVAQAIELSEASTRAGLFRTYTKQAQDLGYDPYNATLYATFKANDYIEFRKAGASMQWMRKFIPFLNAATQGTEKEYRSLIGDLVSLETKRARGEPMSVAELDTLKDRRVAWARVIATGTILGGGSAYLNAQNEEWAKAAGFRRHADYLIFPMGSGYWITVPKPFGIVRNISDLFEYATEIGIRRDPTLVGKFFDAVHDSHSLPYTNPLIDTFYNVRSNYDPFKNRAIVPFSMQGVSPSEQYTAFTSEIAKNIGQATGWSPMKVDYVMKNLGAGMARDFLQTTDNLLRSSTREKLIWDAPLMRDVVKNVSYGNELTTEFYKLVGEKTGSLEQASNAYQHKIKSGERKGAAEFLKSMSEEQRAWTTLMSMGHGIEDKLMHPLFAARTYTDILGGMTRQLINDNLIRESDVEKGNTHLSRRDATPIKVEGTTREKVITELNAAGMAFARNALLTMKAPGMEGIKPVDTGMFFERIKLLAPDVHAELQERIAVKRPHDMATVEAKWPEVRARLLKDGENTDLDNLTPPRPKRRARRSNSED